MRRDFARIRKAENLVTRSYPESRMNATISGSSSTTRSLAGDNKEAGSVAAIYAANLK